MIVRNNTEKKRLVAKLVEDQLKLEKQFTPKVKSLLKDIGSDATNVYISTKTIIPTNNFIPQMIALLRSHYKRVIPKFGFSIRQQLGLKSFFIERSKNIDDDFELESSVYTINHSEEQAKIIMENHEAELERNINKGLVALLLLMGVSGDQVAQALTLPAGERRVLLQSMVDSNTSFNQQKKDKELRRLIKKEISGAAEGRAKAIAITETNNPINFATDTEAELSKRDPAMIIAAAAAGISLGALQKEWVTIGDNRVRKTHVIANTQRALIGATYNVGGFAMRYPTDSSFGAPAREIVNCRCKSITVVGG